MITNEPQQRPSGPLRQRFADQWREAAQPPDVFEFLAQHPNAWPREVADVVLCDLSESWQRGIARPVQVYLSRLPAVAQDLALKSEVIEHDFRLQQSSAEGADLDSYLMQFPGLQPHLRASLSQAVGAAESTHETAMETPVVMAAPAFGRRGRAAPTLPVRTPDKIGRYAVRGVLGAGAFGTVYDAFDESLQRAVAIKQPKQANLSDAALETFQTEARHLAQLHHPGIVPVYDFGVTDDGLCYVVARKIAGETLAEALRHKRFTTEETAELVAQVADALHYAHCQQIVHRDVKPANILLDQAGKPYVADFGLAINEDQQRIVFQGAAGTPAYMPPEQVRGEIRYLDGRADIWSLGVILYEMLTGQRPFRGDTTDIVIDEVKHRDPKPLRVIDSAVPADLERTCLRCLDKLKTQRFATAADLAAELRRSLQHHSQPTAPAAVSAPVVGSLRIVSTSVVSEDGFQIATCTVMNRTSEPLVIIAVRADVLEFQPLRNRKASRELVPTSRLDVTLQAAVGSYSTPLARPVFIDEKDAVSLELRLVCPDSASRSRSLGSVGQFKYRLVMVTDLGLEAATDELAIGRGSG